MYLPVTDTLYVAEAGRGLLRDGQPVRLTAATDLGAVLCACCMDASSDPAENQAQAVAFGRLVHRARNVRATNSLVDVCYTVDGRLGGFVNYCTKIWDIAAPALAHDGRPIHRLDDRDLVARLDAEPFVALRGRAPVSFHPRFSRPCAVKPTGGVANARHAIQTPWGAVGQASFATSPPSIKNPPGLGA
jgi:hypothetical protein